jgi:hypothetical protein
MIDPEQTEAPEIDKAANLLSKQGALVRVMRGRAANVTDVALTLENLPYDLLLISTHCGDDSGYRWTYEFNDDEGRLRRLEVDVAVGVGRSSDPEMVNVTTFEKFHAIDGVLRSDPAWRDVVGSAIASYVRLGRGGQRLETVVRESVERVYGSAA